jgi:hypothetical protein
MKRLLLLWLSLLLVGGCKALGFGGLEVESVGLSAQRPSNVAVYLWAANDGEPLTELVETNFRVYENEQKLDPAAVGLAILPRELAAVHHTLLLVDMSGNDAEARKRIAKGTAAFVQQVRRLQGVTVYAFDGSDRIRLIGDFPQQADGPALESIPALESFQPRDPSRDLYGSVVQALDQLDARLMRTQKPLRIGTLLVFTLGPDLAARVTEDQLWNTLDTTRHQVMAMGVGEEDQPHLDVIGRSGILMAQSVDTIPIAFEDAAMKVRAALERYYLISYCSPSRAGVRTLRVEVSITDREGQEVVGDVQLEFNADGFGPGCDPKALPRFVVQAPASADRSTDGSGVSVGAPPGAQPAPTNAQPAPTEAAPAPSSSGDETEEIVPPPDKPGYAPVE